jgi:hypothetical protein
VKSVAMLGSRRSGLEYGARPPVTRVAGGRAYHLRHELHLGGHLVRPSTTIEPSSSTLARSPSTAHRTPSITGKRRHRRLACAPSCRMLPRPQVQAGQQRSGGAAPLGCGLTDNVVMPDLDPASVIEAVARDPRLPASTALATSYSQASPLARSFSPGYWASIASSATTIRPVSTLVRR